MLNCKEESVRLTRAVDGSLSTQFIWLHDRKVYCCPTSALAFLFLVSLYCFFYKKEMKPCQIILLDRETLLIAQ